MFFLPEILPSFDYQANIVGDKLYEMVLYSLTEQE